MMTQIHRGRRELLNLTWSRSRRDRHLTAWHNPCRGGGTAEMLVEAVP